MVWKYILFPPEQPEKFKDRIEGKKDAGHMYQTHETIKIWDAVKGYFPYTLKDIFPKNQQETGVLLDIKNAWLNRIIF